MSIEKMNSLDCSTTFLDDLTAWCISSVFKSSYSLTGKFFHV